jgi:hypothetical protein
LRSHNRCRAPTHILLETAVENCPPKAANPLHPLDLARQNSHKLASMNARAIQFTD